MLCSKSWLKVGMGEHMMGGVGEKEAINKTHRIYMRTETDIISCA